MESGVFTYCYEDSLNIILSDVDKVFRYGWVAWSEYIEMYTRIYGFCTGDFPNALPSSFEDPLIQKPYVGLKAAEVLFSRIRQYTDDWLSTLNENFNVVMDDPMQIIKNYIFKWKHFDKCITILDGVGAYITRSFVEKDWPERHNGYRTLYSTLAYLWCCKIYRSRSSVLLEIIFIWLKEVRDEDYRNLGLIDEFLTSLCHLGCGDVKGSECTFTIDEYSFSNLNGPEETLLFKHEFLEPFIERSKLHYMMVAHEYFSHSSPDIEKYIRMILETYKREGKLLQNSLSEQCRRSLMESIDEALIDPYRAKISIAMYKMLHNNDYESAKLLLNILFRQPNNISKYKEKFESYVLGYTAFVLNSINENSVNKENVLDIMRDIYMKYKTLINGYMPNMEGLIPILVYVIAQMCNSRSDLTFKINMPKVIAKCMHKNITLITDKVPFTEVTDELVDAVLFMYLIQHRDSFYNYYVNYFERRFIHGKNFSVKLEERVLHNINTILTNPQALLTKMNDGKTFFLLDGVVETHMANGFFSTVPWLSHSGQLSIVESFTVNTLNNYVGYVFHVNSIAPRESSENFNVWLFEQSKWYPFESQPNKVKKLHEKPVFPNALLQWNIYAEDYKKQNVEKKLHLMCDKSTVELVYTSHMGAFTLQLSVYHAIVFICLIEAEGHRLRFEELMKRTGILSIHLSQTIYQLYQEGLFIILRNQENYQPLKNHDFSAHDIIRLNKSFYTDSEIVVPKRLLKEKIAGNVVESESDRKEKAFIVKCAAVRLLKKEHSIDQESLFEMIQYETQGRFIPDFEFIKDCLNELASKDFISANVQENTYSYNP